MKKSITSLIFFAMIVLCSSVTHALLISPSYDIDKYGTLPSPDATGDTTDYNTCWAASLSNMLTYAGWAIDYNNDGIIDPKLDVYQIFLDNFSDTGNSVRNTFSWYVSKYFQILSWEDYWHGDRYDISVMDNIRVRLEAGYGVNVALLGHATTGWGFEYDEDQGIYTHIYLADPDDHWWGLSGVQKYEVKLHSDNHWYIEDYLGISGYSSKIYGATAISRNPLYSSQPSPVPEPSTMLLLATGLAGVMIYRRKAKR